MFDYDVQFNIDYFQGRYISSVPRRSFMYRFQSSGSPSEGSPPFLAKEDDCSIRVVYVFLKLSVKKNLEHDNKMFLLLRDFFV